MHLIIVSTHAWIDIKTLLTLQTDKGFTVASFLVILFICSMLYVSYMQKQDGIQKRSNSSDFTDQQEMVAPLLQEEYNDEEHLHGTINRAKIA